MSTPVLEILPLELMAEQMLSRTKALRSLPVAQLRHRMLSEAPQCEPFCQLNADKGSSGRSSNNIFQVSEYSHPHARCIRPAVMERGSLEVMEACGGHTPNPEIRQFRHQ